MRAVRPIDGRTGGDAAATVPRLEHLRLNGEGKPQVDIVNAGGSPSRELAVRFVTPRTSDTVRLAGWTAGPRRRTATLTQPQPCGTREHVLATLEAESVGAPSIAGVLIRDCGPEPAR